MSTAQASPSLGFAIHRHSFGYDVTEVCTETPIFYFGRPHTVFARTRRERIAKDAVLAIVATEEEGQRRVRAAREAIEAVASEIAAAQERLNELKAKKQRIAEDVLRGETQASREASGNP